MLSECSRRGTVRPTVHGNAAALGVVRRSWEFSDAFSGPVTAVNEGDLTVVADASLYYTADLLKQLGSERPRGGSPSHRILAAYRKWGSDLAAHLEGDFAFILWDATQETLVASRDFAGARPLFYSQGTAIDGSHWISLASVSRALLRDARVTEELDVVMVAATAAGVLTDAGPRTSYRDIRWLPAAHTLVWHPRRGVQMSAHWSPPRWRQPTLSFDEAAVELQRLLMEATRQRLSRHGVTGVSLSGGWDSPAVFGAARAVLRDQGLPAEIVPVSISYPEGDPGREDDLIQQIADFWDAQVHWLQSSDIPILDQPAEEARERELPWAHIYEHWNRVMPKVLSSLDARVLLSGYGGDQLFQVSDIYLSDLFWSFRWLQLRKEWVAKNGAGVRRFFKWAIEPGLPGWALTAIKVLRRGRPLTPYINRPFPDWFAPDFPGRDELEADADRHVPPRRFRSAAEAEGYWYLSEAMFPRVNATITTFALEADVEHRAPLYDRRIVEFAATRPWSDRSLGKETKRLLRAASAGLVPAEVLAPRAARTGTTDGYARTAMEAGFPALLEELRKRPLRLAELGIVDADDFDAACERLLSSPHTGLEHPIFLTAQTELWLRGEAASERQPIGVSHERA